MSIKFGGAKIRAACQEACDFYETCKDELSDVEIMYVTGHSLGGFIAEVVASEQDAPGASFNSPGPWSSYFWPGNMTGAERPEFEVHLTRDDPIASVLFPKPENSAHIAVPIWHPGENHKVCG